MSKSITPVIPADELYTPKETTTYVESTPGLARMAIVATSKDGGSFLRVKRSKAGNRQLEVFFKHADSKNAGQNGVRGTFHLEGIDKNGKSLARQFGDFLAALGVSKEAITSGAASVTELTALDSVAAEDQWKGVPAAVTINGDALNLDGKEVIVKIGPKFNDPTKMRADSVYAVRS